MDSTDDLLLARERKVRRRIRLVAAACLLFLAQYWFYCVHIRPANGAYFSNNGATEAQPESKLLADAVEKGDAAQVSRLLDTGSNPNAVDKAGYATANSALMTAAANNRLDVARLLLDRGADVNLHNYSGRTALYEAVSKERSEMVRLLVHRGADVNAAYSGLTPLGLAKNGLDIPQSAMGHKRLREIIQVLKDAGAADDIFGLRTGQLASALLLLIAGGVFLRVWVRG